MVSGDLKKIGILGGLSPESTIIYYETITREYRRRYNNEKYPEIIIYSLSFGEFVEKMSNGKSIEALNMLVNGVKSLAVAGADFALIAANTPHVFYKELVSRSPIPLLSIIDSLAEELKNDNVNKVGLLATKYTLTHDFYREELLKHGLKALIPSPGEIDEVNRIIFKELTWGTVREKSKERIIEIIKSLKKKGAEAIVLACTELPILFKEKEIVGLKLYDTTRIHAMKALKMAVEEEDPEYSLKTVQNN